MDQQVIEIDDDEYQESRVELIENKPRKIVRIFYILLLSQ